MTEVLPTGSLPAHTTHLLMNDFQLRELLNTSLQEDIGFGDVTSTNIFHDKSIVIGVFKTKATGVIAGLRVIELCYGILDDYLEVELFYSDGDAVLSDARLAEVKGPAAVLLQAERTVLNLLQHMSGVATATKKAVEALEDDTIRVCDTRKTLPGLRMIQKYAVRCGGGFNHRLRLDDGVMIKDNHIKAAGGITPAVQKVRQNVGLMVKVEVETETKAQVLEAVDAGADIIMLDNRSPEEVKKFSSLIPEHIIIEVSGGITAETIGEYRGCGADYISLGYLTHSVQALDISFNLQES